MDVITKIPGLQHISEDIFKFLDKKSLMNCRSTNSSWKNVLDQPIFWLQKLEMDGWKALSKNIEDQHIAKEFVRDLLQLEKENIPPDVRYKWRALLQNLENDNELKEFVLILIKIYYNRGRFLPLELVEHLINANKYPDLVESILENKNPSSTVICNFNFNNKRPIIIYTQNATSIHLAALYGFTEVVEKLSKKYDNPMVKNRNGINAIHLAALNGHVNIVKHLVGLTDAPLTPCELGYSPIHYASISGNLDTVKFLVGLTKTPNAKPIGGLSRLTPIEIAKFGGNEEVQRFLENYCK